MIEQRKHELNVGVGGVVKHLLLSSGSSRTDLAELLGCHPKTIERRINGAYDWDVWEVALMAEHFEVPVSLFYEGPGAFLQGAKNIAILMAEGKEDFRPPVAA